MEQKEANEKIIPRKLLLWITIVIAVGLVLLSLLSIYFVFIYPDSQVSQLGITNVTEKANFINQSRTTFISFFVLFAQILGGGAVAIGIYIGWGNLKVSLATLESNQNKTREELKLAKDTLESNQKNTQKSIEIAQEGQITESFTRAVEQLGSYKLEIRLGGIYALERIASVSDKDYWQIMEILTAYVRKNSSNNNQFKGNSLKIIPISMDILADENTNYEVSKARTVSLDIEAVLKVIRRRKYSYESGETESLNLQKTNLKYCNLIEINLSGADLRGADLLWADLRKANFSMAHLIETKLIGTNFSWADLHRADLFSANLSMAHLIGTNLSEANLTWADLHGADLFSANLSRTHINGTNFSKALLNKVNFSRTGLFEADLSEAFLIEANLSMARLIKTNLSGAYLSKANLEGSDFTEADLSGANLIEAKNLTYEQLSKAKTLYKTELDEGLEAELRAKGFGHLLDDEPKVEP
jgi:uncharacterized protein YjbI with pentapeptide repeats